MRLNTDTYFDANKVFVLTVCLWFGQGGVVADRPSLREVGLQVACVGMCGICKDVGIPPVAISPGKISPCNLLEDMFQNEQVGNILTILVAQVFKAWQEGESPFIGDSGNEKGWLTKLLDCADEIQILVLL